MPTRHAACNCGQRATSPLPLVTLRPRPNAADPEGARASLGVFRAVGKGQSNAYWARSRLARSGSA